jgi:hypothetical protein
MIISLILYQLILATPKRLLAFMFSLNKIVKDDILEICFSNDDTESKMYSITDAKGTAIMQGKIAGQTQRTCLYVGDLKKGTYTFTLGKDYTQEFTIQ